LSRQRPGVGVTIDFSKPLPSLTPPPTSVPPVPLGTFTWQWAGYTDTATRAGLPEVARLPLGDGEVVLDEVLQLPGRTVIRWHATNPAIAAATGKAGSTLSQGMQVLDAFGAPVETIRGGGHSQPDGSMVNETQIAPVSGAITLHFALTYHELQVEPYDPRERLTTEQLERLRAQDGATAEFALQLP
jgi:hypothetical protein